jgi:hypothetical protein
MRTILCKVQIFVYKFRVVFNLVCNKMTFVKIWTLAKHVRILLYEQFKFHMHISYVLFYVIKVQNSSLMIQHKNHVFVVVYATLDKLIHINV